MVQPVVGVSVLYDAVLLSPSVCQCLLWWDLKGSYSISCNINCPANKDLTTQHINYAGFNMLCIKRISFCTQSCMEPRLCDPCMFFIALYTLCTCWAECAALVFSMSAVLCCAVLSVVQCVCCLGLPDGESPVPACLLMSVEQLEDISRCYIERALPKKLFFLIHWVNFLLWPDTVTDIYCKALSDW